MLGGEPGEGAVCSKKFTVGAGFDDTAVGQHEDPVHGLEGAKAVGDGNDGAELGEAIDRCLDLAFGVGIKGGSGFVEDKDGGVANEGPSDSQALTLTAREEDAAFADEGVEALGEIFDEWEGASLAGGSNDLVAGGTDVAGSDVVGDGVVEEDDFLADEGQKATQVGHTEVTQVGAVEGDGAGGGVIEAEEEVHEGAFA